MGRPPIQLNEALIETMASVGNTVADIALVCNCSKDTLERNYMEAIELGRSNMRNSLRKKQFELAMGGSPVMLIWLGKQLLGQRDFKLDMADFTDEMLAAEIRRRMSLGAVTP